MVHKTKKTTWFEKGLEEIGLTKKEYNSLNKKERMTVDNLLKEMGHL
jgi:hypothetical protein